MKPIKKPITRYAGISAVLFLLFAAVIYSSCSREELRLKLEAEQSSPQMLLGIDKLKDPGVAGLVKIVDNRPDFIIQTSVDSINFKPEAFQISVENKIITVTGGDATGVMYGLFDIKEQLESGQGTINPKPKTRMFRSGPLNLTSRGCLTAQERLYNFILKQFAILTIGTNFWI